MSEHHDDTETIPFCGGMTYGEARRRGILPDPRAAETERAARQVADENGYTFGVLTDGTIVLEPPDVKAKHKAECPICDGDKCAKCGAPLDALTRCQNVIPDPAGHGYRIEFVCRDHLAR